jgi:hypothetical protein
VVLLKGVLGTDVKVVIRGRFTKGTDAEVDLKDGRVDLIHVDFDFHWVFANGTELAHLFEFDHALGAATTWYITVDFLNVHHGLKSVGVTVPGGVNKCELRRTSGAIERILITRTTGRLAFETFPR